ncbi:MAG: zf-HC2 domain-containing protein [Deltaproteobacteria bacterium]|nr:zf-HC2 domain-containing protein [Deltaproteobacteria bacterium]
MSHLGENLTAFLDGALSPAEREEALHHLAGCAACRAEEARLRGALAALAALPLPPEPSPAFEQRFHARLARQRSERRGWLARLPARWVLPAAAACAAAVLAVGVELRQRRELEHAARHLDLLESYEAVEAAGDVPPEDAELVAHLHELGGER